MVPPIPKSGRRNNNEDMISELSDCIIIHILSYLNTRIAVRTCVLSKRWKDIWKKIPSLTLNLTQFSTSNKLSIFLSRFSDLRDNSTALRALDFMLITSSNENCQSILSSISTFQTLTTLKLAVYTNPRICRKAFFPDSLKFPTLVNLELTNFIFRDSENVGYVEPFSFFSKLNNLILRGCVTPNAKPLTISCLSLISLSIINNFPAFSYIEISAPCLSSLTLAGITIKILRGSSLALVKELNFGTTFPVCRSSWTLLNLLQELPNIESLTVSACALKVVSLDPDWLKHKLLYLRHLKKLKVKLEPSIILPNGIVDFLLQNSPSAKVEMIEAGLH